MGIVVIEFDSMQVHNFHCQLVNGVKHLAIFGVSNSFLMHIDKRKKDFLIRGEVPSDELDDTTITVGAKYYVNITKAGKKTFLNPYYNGAYSFLHANGVKIYQLK